jgi:hypothetical protein
MSGPPPHGGRPGELETLRLFARALRYMAPLRWRFAAKLGLTILSLAPRLLLPWPAKLIIDHVINRDPVADSLASQPALLRPLLAPLAEMEPLGILLWLLAAQGLLALAIGAVGSTAAEVDRTEGSLSSGRDTATTTENDANYGYSFAGGLLGLFEFRFTLRLTQALNHLYRSRVFERIQSLPMRAFDDERIGDAVYRLMYDTPSITNCYRLLVTPVAAVLGLLVTVCGVRDTGEQQPASPGPRWFLPLALLTTLVFAPRVRARCSAAAKPARSPPPGSRKASPTSSRSEPGSEAREHQRSPARAGPPSALPPLRAHDHPRVRLRRDPRRRADRLRLRPGHRPAIAGVLTPGTSPWSSPTSSRSRATRSRSARSGSRCRSAAGLGRVFELMDWPAEQEAPGARELPPVRHGVRVEDAHFRYADGTPALRGVSFQARVGEITALVGPVGSGKTTLVSLIPRFLAPSAGRVRIDDLDVAGATPHRCRRAPPSSSRKPSSSMRPSRRTSSSGVPRRARPRCGGPPRSRAPTSSSASCRRATEPSWVAPGASSRSARSSASRSRAPWCAGRGS